MTRYASTRRIHIRPSRAVFIALALSVAVAVSSCSTGTSEGDDMGTVTGIARISQGSKAGSPAAGKTVALQSEVTSSTPIFTTDADGRFTLFGVAGPAQLTSIGCTSVDVLVEAKKTITQDIECK